MIKISIKRDKEELNLQVPEDNDLNDWKYIFIAILSWITYDIDSIKNLFDGELDE